MKYGIRTVENFPKPGISFKDIGPLLANKEYFSACISDWLAMIRDIEFDKIACIDSRGFIFGSVLAHERDCGIILIRKKGKMPPPIISIAYDLEYGQDKVELNTLTVKPQDKVLIVDDVIATGGTLRAAIHLLKLAKAEVIGATAIMQLMFLYNSKEMEDVRINSLIDIEN